ncbi:hypothetical protein [Fimbriiglobus ruber]|uniref:SPOR domain-containing protein n=1 Tax=Fimbriiglobus ruber TaxID=1908690 RepID=A0A225DP14_9BACT|nr:hypothetical protein [Fimbriiglobus ruber]OWK38095.1 hypothetical protein FRUB_07215 [Fimbriiglobus ruber]
MRRGIVLGAGLAGVVFLQTGAMTQVVPFAADRTTPQPAPAAPPATAPAPTAPVYPASPPLAAPVTNPFTPAPGAQQPPPAGQAAPGTTRVGYAPADAQVQPPAVTPAASHPMYVHPEHGGWMICVKSYTGAEAKEHAEQLTTEIRQTHQAAAYLFARGAEEREDEMKRRAEVREKMRKLNEPFLEKMQALKKEADAKGQPFDVGPLTFRMPTVEYNEQWAVLVGGFKDMDTARAALNTVRKWAPPKDTRLLDYAVGAVASESGVTKTGAYINPYASAIVVPNPATHHANPNQRIPIDPAVIKWNEGEPLSLLKCKKDWTLLVKWFTVSVKVQSKSDDGSVLGKLLGTNSEAADRLDGTAKQARLIAHGLRDAKMQESIALVAPRLGLAPAPVESYILHLKTGSLVTVGQYDGPDDPNLINMQKLLSGMTFDVDYKDGRPPEKRKLFDTVVPILIPRP